VKTTIWHSLKDTSNFELSKPFNKTAIKALTPNKRNNISLPSRDLNLKPFQPKASMPLLPSQEPHFLKGTSKH
jgi:hypothetical protein